MKTTTKIAAAAVFTLAFVTGASMLHVASVSNESKVTISAQQQPSGETMTTVTVVAKRLNTKEKIAAAFHDARDAMVKHV
jgi:Flp pilus assembly protein CpaB